MTRSTFLFTATAPPTATLLRRFAVPESVFAVPAEFFARCALMDVTARASATSSATQATASGRPPR